MSSRARIKWKYASNRVQYPGASSYKGLRHYIYERRTRVFIETWPICSGKEVQVISNLRIHLWIRLSRACMLLNLEAT